MGGESPISALVVWATPAQLHSALSSVVRFPSHFCCYLPHVFFACPPTGSRWLVLNYKSKLENVAKRLRYLLSKLTDPVQAANARTKQKPVASPLESSAMAVRALLMLWVLAANIPDIGAFL